MKNMIYIFLVILFIFINSCFKELPKAGGEGEPCFKKQVESKKCEEGFLCKDGICVKNNLSNQTVNNIENNSDNVIDNQNNNNCNPVVEICDDKDNDCDGEIDENCWDGGVWDYSIWE